MFLIPIHILATTLMVIFEGNFLSHITLSWVKIVDIKFISNLLSNICHNLMIYILSPCFFGRVNCSAADPNYSQLLHHNKTHSLEHAFFSNVLVMNQDCVRCEEV